MALATLIQNIGDECLFERFVPDMWKVNREKIVKVTNEKLEKSRSKIRDKKRSKLESIKLLKKYQSQKKVPKYNKTKVTGTFLDVESEQSE